MLISRIGNYDKENPRKYLFNKPKYDLFIMLQSYFRLH